jgi:hypothetical protein
MKRMFILSLLAFSLPAAQAGTATFGLFPHYGHCGSCSACPGPWNAFSPRACCAVENAAGCTLFPAGYGGDPYLAGGFPVGGYGHRCGPFGCGLFGTHSGYGWDPSVPYPCGVAGAWHGMPGMGGCADPFGGCGTAYKPTLKDKLANCFKGSATPPPKHLWDYFGGKFHSGHVGFGHGGIGGYDHLIGGGCEGCDAPMITPAPANPTAPVTTPPPATTQPVSFQQPMGYYYPPAPAVYPYPNYGFGYGYYPYAYGYYGR